MKPINIVNSIYAPLDRKNVDTDQIISKEFLKRIERTGFGQFVFYHWRFDENGNPIEDFVLNKPEYKNAEILVAQDNFGCGSSREHAPWAILDYGFRVVIAPSFADIFHNNCFKNGILPIKLTESECDELLVKGLAEAQAIEVNLEQQTVTTGYGKTYSFEIDPYYKQMLLNGWDEISLTFQYEEQITAYEKNRVAY
ncbi:3-isopropylmalate dehydratase small subunit [Solibacillus silvestris StLB046]|uniref:3-isopropylmalate dehydratase small subunit n=1 Tax=Solibacillus silvestris (strain StLB046) TaxID=1002809 RepID=F2F4Q7_SOLSS|nr:3-isopropylmalate dehydratase small subunit [Solibacillus silvestris]BAK16472.1 3-isopropylmalate dehydratase small subunit [Solibacillus silvestris StLB046]